MSLDDKLDSLKDQAEGKLKEVAGKVTGDKELEVEGAAQGLLGKVQEGLEDAAGKVSDAVEGVVEGVKEQLDK